MYVKNRTASQASFRMSAPAVAYENLDIYIFISAVTGKGSAQCPAAVKGKGLNISERDGL
jgi:hypothetical protein